MVESNGEGDDGSRAQVSALVDRWNAMLTEHVGLRMPLQWPTVAAWWLAQTDVLGDWTSVWVASEFDVEFDIGWVLHEGDGRELRARLIDY